MVKFEKKARIVKNIECSVEKCKNNYERSISLKLVSESGLKLKSDKGKKAYLCKEHYKEYKKKSKDDRQVQKWRWDT